LDENARDESHDEIGTDEVNIQSDETRSNEEMSVEKIPTPPPSPAIRKSTRMTSNSSWLKDYALLMKEEDIGTEEVAWIAATLSPAFAYNTPSTYKQAIEGPQAREWQLSMEDEYNSLTQMRTW